MSLYSVLRSVLRPLYRTVMPRRTQSTDPCGRYESALESSYLTLSQLSTKGDIAEVFFVDGHAVIVMNDGRRYHFDPHDRVARMYTVPQVGTFEAKETNMLRRHIKAGQICFDVGASFGWYTVLLGNLVGPSGHVHAFEPVPHNFHVLQRNVTLNECSNVTLNQAALDATSGRRNLFLPDIGVSGSFRLHRYEKSYQAIPCRTLSLDDYCQKKGLDKVDFIKADIEGAEWLMLKGAKKVIERNHPVLLLEIQSSSTRLYGYEPAQLFEWLESLQYIPHFVSDAGHLMRLSDYRASLPDYNFFLLPEQGV